MVVFALFLFKNLVPLFWTTYMAKISKDIFVYVPLQLSIQEGVRLCPTAKAERMRLNLCTEYKP